MANPVLLEGSASEKLDPIVDGSGVTGYKLGIGTKSLGSITAPGKWTGSATHAQGDAIAAADGISVAGGQDESGNAQPLLLDAAGALITSPATPVPGLPFASVLNDSATGAGGGPTNATLDAVIAKTSYISGFQVTGLGATEATSVVVTVEDALSAWIFNYAIAVPAGVDLSIVPLIVTFDPPFPASAPDTGIVVTVPDFGSGNTLVAVSAQGFAL